MIKAIENVKISSGNTTTIVNGQRKEFAKKVSLLNDVTDWQEEKLYYIGISLIRV